MLSSSSAFSDITHEYWVEGQKHKVHLILVQTHTSRSLFTPSNAIR